MSQAVNQMEERPGQLDVDDLFDWLEQLEMERVRDTISVEFLPEGVQGRRLWVKVTRYARNAAGARFLDPKTKGPAAEVLWVPVTRLPIGEAVST